MSFVRPGCGVWECIALRSICWIMATARDCGDDWEDGGCMFRGSVGLALDVGVELGVLVGCVVESESGSSGSERV